jgi:F-type H+-transporting ATPase subunit delta
MRLLLKKIKIKNVVVSFAGELSNIDRKKITMKFSNKNILFKRDDYNIIGGMRFEYADFVLDCSVSGILKRTLNAIRENL